MSLERKRNQRKLVSFWIFSLLLVGSLGGLLGLSVGAKGYTLALEKGSRPIKILHKQPPPEQTVDFSLFWQVWEILNRDYLFQPLESQELVYGALAGLAQATDDPFTAFLTPEQNEIMSMRLNGRYEGVGAELAVREGSLLVVSPLDGSPAKAAGILPGDIILKIDGESVAAMTLTEAVSRIRGEAETEVVLTIQREEGAPFEAKIIRAQITLASVTRRRVVNHPELAYLRISRFGESMQQEWDEAVRFLVEGSPALEGIVLDLRGNPGGYFEGSVKVAGEFLELGTLVVTEEFGDGSHKKFLASGGGRLQGLPVVVLIDRGSASSSEILAQALRENRGALLVGETSFGKGTVQEAKDFPDGSGLHVTAAKWLSPQGLWFHEEGLEPDVELAVGSEEREEDSDPQLEKAVEVLVGSEPN